MRIATWNVERLKHKKDLDKMLLACEEIHADILVLTETDERMKPSFQYYFHTPLLKNVTDPVAYADTENRVSIFTNFKCVREHPTCNKNTAICVELETFKGNLLVYGTIIGILGNRDITYNETLKKQLADISRFADSGYDICVVGDFNCTFCDNYYFTKFGRDIMSQSFAKSRISLLTKDISQCIDHIAVSERFIRNVDISIREWNLDKLLSDHKGIVAEIL